MPDTCQSPALIAGAACDSCAHRTAWPHGLTVVRTVTPATTCPSTQQLPQGQPGLYGQVGCWTTDPGVYLLASPCLISGGRLSKAPSTRSFALAGRALRLLSDRPTRQPPYSTFLDLQRRAASPFAASPSHSNVWPAVLHFPPAACRNEARAKSRLAGGSV
ncbi:hypothetical protein BKA80DRAFT_86055 [Phyllosticta citrichinensis]